MAGAGGNSSEDDSKREVWREGVKNVWVGVDVRINERGGQDESRGGDVACRHGSHHERGFLE
jgi:hypothetical protein